ncbi:MAG TPA: YcaO-like family protein, partial [Allosphingosinicella sp.]|nr:YcaO-like family protein [Allosphingosinicella sp.]
MSLPGPERDPRAMPDPAFLEQVSRAARTCGVTRLADVTRLDRPLLPVWQAVRPAGKSLSVHQGKGVSALAAKTGALCEAIESHCAENAPADGPLSSFAALPGWKPHCLADYGGTTAEEPIRWCSAADLLTGEEIFLPHPLVSLDFTDRS